MAKDGSIEYTSLSEEEQLDLFEEFQATFDRQYESKKEEKSRYKYFLEFLEKVDERNAKEKKAGGTAVHGLTMFADMSDEEFRSNYLGYSKPKSDSSSKKNIAKVDKYKGKETSADWRGVYTTDVNNQGVCGSCWAFSVAEQVESDSIRAGLLTTDDKLSAQQIVSW
jgi:C1A family cysteine protease